MDFAAPETENLLALAAIGLSLLSLSISLLTYYWSERREHRVEKSSAYLNLEVNSSEVFKYAAERAELMKPFRCESPPPGLRARKNYEEGCEVTLNLYFQSLNLFEVCARFRRQGIIEPQVFASWVAWFYELLDDWYFRKVWDKELRANYTRDVRAIFDVGCEILAEHGLGPRSEKAFFQAVADIMESPSQGLAGEPIRVWHDELKRPVKWESLSSHRDFPSPGTSRRQPQPPPPPSPRGSSAPTPPISATEKSRPG